MAQFEPDPSYAKPQRAGWMERAARIILLAEWGMWDRLETFASRYRTIGRMPTVLHAHGKSCDWVNGNGDN